MNSRKYIELEPILAILEDDYKIMKYISDHSVFSEDLAGIEDEPKKEEMYKYYIMAKELYINHEILNRFLEDLGSKLIPELNRFLESLNEV